MGTRLGAFELDQPLARGGMGEVWRAAHRRSGRPVAIKVILDEHARQPVLRRALEREVRAMARLDHPNIVAVLDHGTVTDDAEELVPGSPYVVMPLIDGGSLASQAGRLDWYVLRRVLLELLSALAHAHARGVLHRDVKPSNVLQAPDGSVLLTDFGLAHPLGVSTDQARIEGTPAFMAPEQRSGRWRDFGRWTDLFALGRLCEVLVDPEAPVPESLEAWLGRMTAQSPADRLRTAADAAWLLKRLGPPDRPLDRARVDLERTSGATTISLDGLFDAPDAPAPADTPRARLPAWVRPFCPDWRRALDSTRPVHLHDAGLGLFGLRVPPFQGRLEARDRLWAALQAVHGTGRTEAIVLTGPPGVGKTRLASWLGERALELGAGLPLVVRHDPLGDPGAGLDAMFAGLLGAAGLSPLETRARVHSQIREWDLIDLSADALTALLHPEATELRLRTPRERHAVRRRLLAHLARERPLVLVLDDVQWGTEAVGFVEHLLGGEPLPVLAILTVEAPLAPSLETRLESWTALELGPLARLDQRALIRGLLAVSPALERGLVDRTREPLEAVQLLQELVESDAIEPGPEGFRLRAGCAVPSPGEDHWLRRVERVLAERSHDDRVALELAAVCGASVVHEDWRETCVRAGVTPSADLVDVLTRAGLVQGDEPGRWWLVHGQLRTALLQLARLAGRLVDHHRLRAALLSDRPSPDPSVLGEHLVHSQQVERALDVLLQGSRYAAVHSDPHRARGLLRAWWDLALAHGLPTSDPRRGRAALLRASIELNRHRTPLAETLAREALDLARARGWEREEVLGEWLLARLAHVQGRSSEAEEPLRRTLAWGRAHDDDLVVARSTIDLGRVALSRAEYATAEPLMHEAWEAYGRLQIVDGQNLVAGELCDLYRRSGRLDDAELWLVHSEQTAQRLGDPGNRADAWVLRGELARSRGRIEDAEDAYREALVLLQLGGDHEGEASLALNLSMVLEQRDELAEALRLAEWAIRWLEEAGRHALVAISHGVALPPAAGLGDAVAFDHHLDRAADYLERAQLAHPDLLDVFERAALRAAGQGWAGRADAANALAVAQRTLLEAPASTP